jgi:hypothetical protein
MIKTTVPETSRRSRAFVLAGGLAIVLALGAGFWFAAQFQSSAQQEANAKAPAPGPVFAEVTQGSLAGEVSFAGQVGPSTQTPVTVTPAPTASLAVVTGRPLEAGATASSGQVLTEVNGRPLFGVQSPFAFYRDMGVGDRGPDVEALQRALAARSYPVAADGRFGAETSAAVTRWYRDSGYEPSTRITAADKTTPGETPEPEDRDVAAPAPAPEGYVPVADLVAMPTTTAQVVQGVHVGERLAIERQPDLILGSADLVVTITVPATDLGDVVAGDAATISIDGVTVEGTVGVIPAPGAANAAPVAGEPTPQGAAEAPGSEQAAEVRFAVVPTTPLPAATGRARVTVTKQIVAENALIVPVLAVSDRGAAKNVLTKQEKDGSFVEVPVSVLGTLQGEVAVEPVKPGALTVGDRVRVG